MEGDYGDEYEEYDWEEIDRRWEDDDGDEDLTSPFFIAAVSDDLVSLQSHLGQGADKNQVANVFGGSTAMFHAAKFGELISRALPCRARCRYGNG